MSTHEYRRTNEQQWTKAIAGLFPVSVPSSATWTGLDRILAALTLVCRDHINHSYLPTGGGMDLIGVSSDVESATLALEPHPNSEYVVKPKALSFEDIADSRVNSFFLLTLEVLDPILPDESLRRCGFEELLQTPDRRFFKRSCLDEGHLGHDEAGNEIPIPSGYKIVTRFSAGSILIVAKASLWNQTPAMYGALHNKLGVTAIRKVIEDAVNATLKR